jgi:hypothetical protein
LHPIEIATNAEIVTNIESIVQQYVKTITTKFTGKDSFVADHRTSLSLFLSFFLSLLPFSLFAVSKVCAMFIQSLRRQQSSETFQPLKNQTLLHSKINAFIALIHR